MKIWLDTFRLDLISTAKEMGILSGVTTNPSIVAKSSLSLEQLLQQILSAQEGPVTAQVTADAAPEMIAQGKAFFALSPRLIVKVPVTREGLKAIHRLKQLSIPTMATAVFDGNQVLLAARAGAQYIAPYFSSICESDIDGIALVGKMLDMIHRYRLPSELVVASLRTAEQVKQCAEMGAPHVTLNDKVFQALIEDHPMTVESVQRLKK